MTDKFACKNPMGCGADARISNSPSLFVVLSSLSLSRVPNAVTQYNLYYDKAVGMRRNVFENDPKCTGKHKHPELLILHP
ncbi:hypothetical protein ACTXT7_016608, partial [Hymenolepis weldensis]